MDFIDLSDYIRLFRKWLWLLLLATVLAGGTSFVLLKAEPPIYEARALVSVGGFIQAPNPDTAEIRTGFDLARTYAVLATTRELLQATIEAQGFPLTINELQKMLDVRVVTDTSILEVSVTNTDPNLVADVANAIAEQLVLRSPTNLTPEQEQQRSAAEGEIDRLNEQLQMLRARLDQLNSALETATSDLEIASLTDEWNQVVTFINQASTNLASLTSSVTTIQERTNSLTILEPAARPVEPSGPNVVSDSILAAIAGFVLAFVIVVVVEYLDDTIKTHEEASRRLPLPILGTILRFGRSRANYAKRLITVQNPDSPISESYRALRTNLLFSGDGTEKHTYVITSASAGEGKSVTAANLAVSMATTNRRVLLIDADLRQPTQHKLFELDNDKGLASLSSQDPPHDGELIATLDDLPDAFQACVQETKVANLRVMTSGPLPPNPTELLDSEVMKSWFDALCSVKDVDVIIFDTPPMLGIADSMVLAMATDGFVVLVLKAGRTRGNAVWRAIEQFEQLDMSIGGVVLNAARTHGPRGYTYEYVHSTAAETSPRHNSRQSDALAKKQPRRTNN